jgi:hypothetical protein
MLPILASLYGAATSPAVAARLYVLDHHARNDPNTFFFSPICNVKIDGEIRAGDGTPDNPGDYATIKTDLEAFARHPAIAAVKKTTIDPAPGEEPDYLDFYPRSNTGLEPKAMLAVCVSGPGGDIAEALRISRLFPNWIPVIEQDDDCISACAVLFMKAGSRRDHVFYFRADDAGRFMHFSARLGFHAPRLELPGNPGDLASHKDIAEAYARALATMRAVMFYDGSMSRPAGTAPSFADRWSSSVSLPPDLIMAFLAMPPDEVFYVTTIGEAMKWGIEIYGVPPPPKLTQRLLATACQNVITTRCSSLEPYERHEGECHHWLESIPVIGANDTPITEWHRDPTGRRQWLGMSAGSHPWLVRKLWPAPGARTPKASAKGASTPVKPAPKSPQPKARAATTGQVAIEAFEMREACQVKATWVRDKLVDLELTTFNGITDRADYDASLPNAGRAAEIEQADRDGSATFGSNHVQPWKMLPAAARLSGLADAPWAWLDEGPAVFSRSPGW